MESQRESERRGEGPILIDRPKRLEIAVSQTKQTTEAVSNRIKIDPPAGRVHGATDAGRCAEVGRGCERSWRMISSWSPMHVPVRPTV
jgi:hypothetical protein